LLSFGPVRLAGLGARELPPPERLVASWARQLVRLGF
jgi:hypothetical protein